MKKPTFNYDDVAKICNRLIEQGKMPSIQLVRSELRGGSPNRVLGYLRQWQKEHELSTTIEDDLSAEFRQAVLAECARKLKAVKERLQSQINERDAQISELQEILATAEEEIDELAAELENLKKETETKYRDYENQLAKATEQVIVRTEFAHEVSHKADKQFAQLREELDKMQEAKHQSDIRAATAEAKNSELERQLRK